MLLWLYFLEKKEEDTRVCNAQAFWYRSEWFIAKIIPGTLSFKEKKSAILKKK